MFTGSYKSVFIFQIQLFYIINHLKQLTNFWAFSLSSNSLNSALTDSANKSICSLYLNEEVKELGSLCS